MVLKESDVRGDEDVGTRDTTQSILSGAASLGFAAMQGLSAIAHKAVERKEEQQIPPQIKGQYREDLYQAFLDRGVPEEVASDAADAAAMGEDESSSPAIAEAHRIVEENALRPSEEEVEDSLEDVEEETEESSSDEQEVVSTSQQSPTAEAAVPPPQQSSAPPSAATATTVGDTAAADSEPKASVDALASRQGENLPHPQAVGTSQSVAGALTQPLPSEPASEQVAPSKQVEISKSPSEMSWKELQQTAKAIREETGQSPEGKKRPQVEAFVENYRVAQFKESLKSSTEATQPEQASQAEQAAQPETAAKAKQAEYASTVVTPEAPKAPLLYPEGAGLETAYNAGLKAAEVDDKTAKKAAKAIVNGEGANSSDAIKSAHAQVEQKSQSAVQSPLQQLYYDVLKKQGIDSDLASSASTDLANGKGAYSSKTVRAAHSKIMDRELMTTGGKTPQERSYQKHSRYVKEKDPLKRDQATARNAAKAGLSQKKIEGMLRFGSPVVKGIHEREGSSQAIKYFKGLAREVSQMAPGKSASVGKRAITPERKKGVEV